MISRFSIETSIAISVEYPRLKTRRTYTPRSGSYQVVRNKSITIRGQEDALWKTRTPAAGFSPQCDRLFRPYRYSKWRGRNVSAWSRQVRRTGCRNRKARSCSPPHGRSGRFLRNVTLGKSAYRTYTLASYSNMSCLHSASRGGVSDSSPSLARCQHSPVGRPSLNTPPAKRNISQLNP
jgi:hypothetical protein